MSSRARFKELAEEKARRLAHTLATYRPYPKQMKFHEEGARYRQRLLRAGNQQGKTHAGSVEKAYHLTGLYPDWWKGRRFDRPIVAWAASDTAETTRDNPQRALFGLVGDFGSGAVPGWLCGDKKTAIGVADLFDYVKVKHVSGGYSTVRLKYYAQGRQKWQGPPVDVVWFDEEPPPDIYDEGRARTIATLGMVYTTFTPLMGMTDVVRRFLVEKKEGLCDINMTIDDAEHIPIEERAATIAGFAEHEREARARGVPTLGSGRIYPVADSAISFEAFPYPEHWAQLGGLDFGWDHPTAAVRLRWDRDSDIVYVTDAYRKKEATPVVHAGALRAWQGISFAWPHDGLQHDKGSGETLKAQYEDQGLLMLPERAQFEDGGNSVEAGTTMILDRMQTGRFMVAAHLGDWFEEFRLYHREDGRIVKVGDDLLDATRYAVMMLRFAEVVRASSANVIHFGRFHQSRATSRVV